LQRNGCIAKPGYWQGDFGNPYDSNVSHADLVEIAYTHATEAVEAAKVAHRQAVRTQHLPEHNQISANQATKAAKAAAAAADAYTQAKLLKDNEYATADIYNQTIRAYRNNKHAQEQTYYVGKHTSPCRDLETANECDTRDSICNWQRNGCTAKRGFWKGDFGNPTRWIDLYENEIRASRSRSRSRR
jgi:hypothetical protein